MDRETRLGILASAILEGTPVDWTLADPAGDPSDREVVSQLQVLSEIAALHRGSAGPAPAARTAAGQPRTDVGPPAPPGPTGPRHLRRRVSRLGPHLDREVALKLLRARPSPNGAWRVAQRSRRASSTKGGCWPACVTPRDHGLRRGAARRRGRHLDGADPGPHAAAARRAARAARSARGGRRGLDLCRALAAVHAAGLLHRDVTARNVMRENGGRIVLMDFGAGHDSGAPAERGPGGGHAAVHGARGFGGGAADRRSDIYSLGVLLFYVVSGSFPVTGRSLDQIRDAHAQGTRARLRDTRRICRRRSCAQSNVRSRRRPPIGSRPPVSSKRRWNAPCSCASRRFGRLAPRAAPGLGAMAAVAAVGVVERRRAVAAAPHELARTRRDATTAATSVTMRKLSAVPACRARAIHRPTAGSSPRRQRRRAMPSSSIWPPARRVRSASTASTRRRRGLCVDHGDLAGRPDGRGQLVAGAERLAAGRSRRRQWPPHARRARRGGDARRTSGRAMARCCWRRSSTARA